VRVLHLAAHGVVDDRSPLESYLVLAAGAGEDGLLRAWEVFEQVRCPGSLVVLSACETGLGPNLGGEGMIGLTRSFHYAGASNVVSSLWQVSDRSTAALMAAFYQAIEDGAGPAEALRRAQLALLLGEARVPRTSGGSFARLLDGLGLGARARPLDLSAPFHWAAFQVHGR
jgi:CHAT domain-containing protein